MNGENKDSQGTANFVATFFQEYKNVVQQEKGIPNRINQKWKKPPHGIVKINFDGNVRKADKRKGVGVIAKDDKGKVLGAVQATIDVIIELAVIEAYAANRGLLFAHQMGFTKIILEGDALSVIFKILQLDPSLSHISNLTKEAKS